MKIEGTWYMTILGLLGTIVSVSFGHWVLNPLWNEWRQSTRNQVVLPCSAVIRSWNYRAPIPVHGLQAPPVASDPSAGRWLRTESGFLNAAHVEAVHCSDGLYPEVLAW